MIAMTRVLLLLFVTAPLLAGCVYGTNGYGGGYSTGYASSPPGYYAPSRGYYGGSPSYVVGGPAIIGVFGGSSEGDEDRAEGHDYGRPPHGSDWHGGDEPSRHDAGTGNWHGGGEPNRHDDGAGNSHGGGGGSPQSGRGQRDNGDPGGREQHYSVMHGGGHGSPPTPGQRIQ